MQAERRQRTRRHERFRRHDVRHDGGGSGPEERAGEAEAGPEEGEFPDVNLAKRDEYRRRRHQDPATGIGNQHDQAAGKAIDDGAPGQQQEHHRYGPRADDQRQVQRAPVEP
jgi:hypothetical protein